MKKGHYASHVTLPRSQARCLTHVFPGQLSGRDFSLSNLTVAVMYIIHWYKVLGVWVDVLCKLEIL